MKEHYYVYSWTVKGEDYSLVGNTCVDKDMSGLEIRDKIYQLLKRVIGSSTGVLKFKRHAFDRVSSYEIIDGSFV